MSLSALRCQEVNTCPRRSALYLERGAGLGIEEENASGAYSVSLGNLGTWFLPVY